MMSVTYDLCIIGAGLFGSAAARHASADPSLKVCLIGPDEPNEEEKADREIFSSHYDEGRIVHHVINNTIAQSLVKNSIKRFREVEKLSGIDFYHPVGTLHCAAQAGNRFLNFLQNLEVHNVPFLALDEHGLKTRYPFLDLDEFHHNILDDNGAGHVSPRNLVKAQKRIAHLQGCCIIKEVVEEVKDFSDGVHKVVTEHGGIIEAKRILFCTGAFTKYKKLHQLNQLNITVHKETAALLEISEKERNRLSSMPTMIMRFAAEDLPPTVHGVYILPPIQYPDGKFYLKIGPAGHQRNSEVTSLQDARDWYSSNGDSELMQKLPNLLKKFISDLQVEKIKSKICITSNSPSDLPYIDRLTPTVTVAVVGNGYGATVCEEVGRLAAVLSVTGKWDTDLPKSAFEAIFQEK